jgi:hypothetical protein
MFSEPIEMAQASYNWKLVRQLLLSLIALSFALTIHPSKAHAQIVGNLEANIPFQFHAGDAKLPAGKYFIHALNNSDLSMMEITSADGSNSTPAKSELIFNKYGNRYFLAKLFDEGNPDGSTVDESHYEKTVSQANVEAQAHVPAFHHGQPGN